MIRIIYFRRFRAAGKIGKAGKLLAAGNSEDALVLLEKTGKALHESLLPLYAFTRGKILDDLNRRREAEEAFKLVVLTDRENNRAYLELAILAGRRFDFKECEEWLDRLAEKEINDDIEEQILGIRDLLRSITSGKREKEFQKRADAMAAKISGNDHADNSTKTTAIKEWITLHPDEAAQDIDEIALLMGQTLVSQGGAWKINLSIEDSVVISPDKTEINPFKTAASMLK